jgi:hypothetical protein
MPLLQMRSDCTVHHAGSCAAAAGGWRGLFVWYRRTVLSPKGRVWIDNGQGGVHVPISIAGFGEVTVGSVEVCGPQGQQVSRFACCSIVTCSPWGVTGVFANLPAHLGTCRRQHLSKTSLGAPTARWWLTRWCTAARLASWAAALPPLS